MQRLLDRLDQRLEKRFPEQRLFLKSDSATRYVRLRPLTQAVGIFSAVTFFAWGVLAASILLMDSIGSGNIRDQAAREQAYYETRLNDLAAERDARASETETAQSRFTYAMERISDMQSALLASEQRRIELETGIEVIQRTLRRTVDERDAARAHGAELARTLTDETGTARTGAEQAQDVAQTLDFLMSALDTATSERDNAALAADDARRQADHLALEVRLIQDRNTRIFAQLEEAIEMSVSPLERIFTNAGLSVDTILRQVRSGYQSQSAALQPISMSTSGSYDPDSDEARANRVLAGLDELNLYRVATERLPFARPVSGARQTSSFGVRRDPRTGASRQHNGVDWAAAQGTTITATSAGRVKFAGRQGGYGNLVIIEHDFGIETYYAHLHRINVSTGQRVSRGDKIGGMGTTGRSTGVHLHYEIRVGGTPLNPMTYIRAAQNVF
ncbi:DUF5930 domain-containing protein [Roseicitreum antarcticum]|uniref:Murein DD-endopeptidase MepM and murein hydrolase activator NlpD, contain LysM domain n=1 Tax=Roseicitreum antarcticum TaxID=564137 RepID=A0A1H2ZXK4_9RHOB|nr:DUF5930 domain-containing protein [Roseicitreum antarcticum]SDX21981.1 Murein DD-endopeptidase MepM and murein hydrolase activator NlpD, contain LysM domain [Roseicitreum antarcticum]